MPGECSYIIEHNSQDIEYPKWWVCDFKRVLHKDIKRAMFKGTFKDFTVIQERNSPPDTRVLTGKKLSFAIVMKSPLIAQAYFREL